MRNVSWKSRATVNICFSFAHNSHAIFFVWLLGALAEGAPVEIPVTFASFNSEIGPD